MSGNDWFWAMATAVLRNFPDLAIGIVCLGFAISRRPRHPRVSKFAMVGAAGLLVIVLLRFALEVTLGYVQDQITGPSQVARIIAYFEIAVYPTSLIALGFLTAAIFIDRNTVPSTENTEATRPA